MNGKIKMYDVICILLNVYFAVSFMRAGYAYCEWKDKDGAGWNTFLNALFYGFFGLFMEIYYSFSDRCGNCKRYRKGRCKKTGRFTGKFCKSCSSYEKGI